MKADNLDDHDYWTVDMMLTPSPDGDVSDLVLVDDAITREIRNHFIFATARADEAAGTAANVVGVLQYPTSRLSIPRTTSRIHAAHARFGSGMGASRSSRPERSSRRAGYLLEAPLALSPKGSATPWRCPNGEPVWCRNAIEENVRGIAEFVTVDRGLYERDRGAYKARRGA